MNIALPFTHSNERAPRYRIAVVGSGIAGLCAVWALGAKHHVTLYEAQPRIGMDAHSIDVPTRSGTSRVDVPMRVLFPEYYPTLSRVYAEAGVATEPLEYSASFSTPDGRLLFRYKNLALGGNGFPAVAPKHLLRRSVREIGVDALRFFSLVRRVVETDDFRTDETLSGWLARQGVPSSFQESFLLPAFAGICTCSYRSLWSYPARTIITYLGSGLFTARMHRVSAGVAEVCDHLSSRATVIRTSSPVERVFVHGNMLAIRDSRGESDVFDHVVVATQADHAFRFVDEGFYEEREVLSTFEYEGFDVVVHRDPALAPVKRSWWSPVNYLVREGASAPMATIWLNGVHRDLGPVPLFQTWNPNRRVDPNQVLGSAHLTRPLANRRTRRAIAAWDALREAPARRLWLCGSYAADGIPLQESAAFSALAVADAIQRSASSEGRELS